MSLTEDATPENDRTTELSFEDNKDNVEELLQTWSAYSATLPSNDATLLGIAVEICKILSRRNSFNALEVFLERLPKISEYDRNEDILRSKVTLAVRKRQSRVVVEIIKNNDFEDGEDLIKAWDEAHYIMEEDRLQKPLTPLARFRVRKRHPPPQTICPTGVRKMASLPKGATRVLKQWLMEHYHDPYPTGEEKVALAKLSGLSSNQVKTWFANARRRIHKGGGSLPGKGSHSAFEIKDHGRKPLMSRSDALDSYASLNLPPDASPAFSNCLQSRFEHTCDVTDHAKMANFSYRCLHSVYNSHACLHCKGMPQVTPNYDEYGLADRYTSHTTNSGINLPVYPTPGYSFPRWPYYAPVQYRHEDFDPWYRGQNNQSDFHTHYQDFDPTTMPVERIGSLDNTTLIDSCLQNSNNEQGKTPSIQIGKDELTDVGAARILADLSTKPNFSLQYDDTDNIISQGNHI